MCQAYNDQPWELSGSVSSDTGPVKGIIVELRSRITERPIWTKTDGHGDYRLAGTKSGEYTLTIQKDSNLPDVSPPTLTLQAGKKIAFNIHIPKGAVLVGRVVDQDKRPVKGALVRALAVRHDQSGTVHLSERGGDRTNDRGEFRIPYLAAGRYVLATTGKVLRFEMRSAPLRTSQSTAIETSFYPSGHDFASSVVLDLVTGQELLDLEIRALSKPAACLAFTVGQGFSGHVSGSVEDRLVTNGPQLAVGPLNTDKTYQVCGLARGEYTLRIDGITLEDRSLRLAGAQMEFADLSKGSVDLGSVQPLGIGTVSGAITFAKQGQNTATLSSVTLLPNPLELQLPVVETIPVQPDGTFSNSDIARGEYRLSVLYLPSGYYVSEASQKGRNVLVRGLLPGDGDVEIQIANDGASLSGLVVNADNKPVLDATVFLVPDNGAPPLHVQSDQDGKYSFSAGVPPGTYRVAALPAVPEHLRDDFDFAMAAMKRSNELQLDPGQKKEFTMTLSE